MNNCEHRDITTFVDEHDIPANLWACEKCREKFVPISDLFEVEQRLAEARRQLLMSNALPRITDEIYNDYGFDVFIELIDGKPQWTQAAIDFAALLDEGKVNESGGE